MTDRELLQMAAKAAGVELADNPTIHFRPPWLLLQSGEYWNPLIDDGDALRLAVRLYLQIRHNDPGEAILWVSAVLNKRWLQAAEEFNREEERDAATRRAIVRAAAEIGWIKIYGEIS